MLSENKPSTYQYDILLQAIEFFTQRFHVQQVVEYGFRFTNQLFNLKSSALFVREDYNFVLKKHEGYQISSYTIKSSKKLDDIPLFHGNILTSNLHVYFTNEDIQLFNMKMVIPLIIDTELYGFIISNGKSDGNFTDKDYAFCDRLMRLINNSLENNQRFLDYQKINSSLDRKIFNLFVMNQSTKALLSELNLENLYSIATDVFSEITGSKVTSFGIYDSLSNKIKMSGYRNVNSFSGFYTELELMTKEYSSNQIVLNMEDDIETIKSIFKNWEDLKRLQARYIVLIVKKEITGVVTISDSVNGEPYTSSEFELIESLANATLISITNAKLFRELSVQKEQIERKYDSLATLNRLVRNINSCETKEELFDLVLKMLEIGYGVKKAIICTKSNHVDYTVNHALGLNDLVGKTIELSDSILLDEDTIYDFQAEHVASYFKDVDLINKIEDVNGIIISPINFKKGISETKGIFGYLIVLETKENLKEEEILIIDTITKNFTPILYHMNHSSEMINPKEKFLQHVTEKIQEKEWMNIDFYIYFKKINSSFFKRINKETINLDAFLDDQIYYIDNYVFVISILDKCIDGWQKMISPSSVEDIIELSL